MNTEPTRHHAGERHDLRPLTEIELSDRVVWGLVDSAPDGLLMVDDRGRIVFLNRQIEDLFGYDRGELLGQSVDQLLPDERRQVHRAHRTRYRAEPQIRAMGAAMALQGQRADGTRFPVEISLSPLTGDGDELLVIAAVRDVSARVEAEALDAEVRHGLDVVEDGVFMFEVESLRFTYVNQGAVDQVGYSRQELLAMSPIHIKPDFTEASFREMLEPLVRDETASIHFTTVHRRKDGSDLPVEIVLQSPTPGPWAGRRGCVALVRDISQRLESERLLAAARQQASLLEDRERMARDMHDTVIQELFATGMSLQATMGAVGDAAARERMLAAVDAIDDTIKQIRTTIFGLRSGDAWDAGVQRAVLGVASSASQALGYEPTVDFDGPVDELPGQLVEELLPTVQEALSNVARHARASAVEVALVVTERSVVLRVVDNGVGIAVATTDRPGGNGLGNMQARATGLGGRCTITSCEGGGTRVEWEVPRPS